MWLIQVTFCSQDTELTEDMSGRKENLLRKSMTGSWKRWEDGSEKYLTRQLFKQA